MEGLRPDLPSMAEHGEICTLHAEVFELRRAKKILEFAEPHRDDRHANGADGYGLGMNAHEPARTRPNRTP